MKQIFVLALFTLYSAAWGAKVYTVETAPKPALFNKSYVSDPDHVLKDETIRQINKQIYFLEQVTTDQIAVVILPSINWASSKEFARRLYNRYRIGQQDKDNGLLIFVVMKPFRVEFETGLGMEGVLPEETCHHIVKEYMTPYFKEGDYDRAILEGLTAVIKVLNDPQNKDALSDGRTTDPQALEKIIVWILAVPYLLFMSVFYFVKKSKGAFTEDYAKLSEAKKKNVSLTIPRWRWLLLYFFLPLFFYAGMIYFYTGPYYTATLIAGAYGMILLTLVDKKSRCEKAYAGSYKEGDYFNQYNQFSRYFDNWGIAAIFFPVPFLFTDAQNNKKLQAIRKHERSCTACGTAMGLLDEKKEDQYLRKSQILEESIKSVDYDVWLCPACDTHYALGYNSKFSKYKACSYCGTKASFLKSDIAKVPPTHSGSGTGEKTFQCMYCKKTSLEEYVIPPLAVAANKV
ncbi:MAG: hypothetical protein K0R51_2971 [Cytophagaceae bacterium]|jgi:uncharacterized protein|nr:hypothetical protein [Cytophagaceae bacterium]